MKEITIAIIFMLVVLSVAGISIYRNINNDIKFGDIKIDSSELKDLTEPIGDGKFVLCSMDENKCGISIKRSLN